MASHWGGLVTVNTKVSLATVVSLAIGAALLAQNSGGSAPLFVDHDEMKAKFEVGGLVAEASTYRITASHRDGTGRSEVHETVTDIFYVTEGRATVVLGGELVNGEMTRPREYRGEAIRNGEAYEVSAGDVLVIPAGTPHWFQSVPDEVSYLVVKVIPE